VVIHHYPTILAVAVIILIHMPPPQEKRPHSFGEFVALIEEQQSKGAKPLWFRGVDSSDYQLLPTLYRHPLLKSLPSIDTLEKNVMMRFRQRSLPFITRQLTDEWDRLFFMQHYGIPTRLLDWTENPFIGLYFALMGPAFKGSFIGDKAELTFLNDAAVWMLDPVAWNAHALKHLGFDRGILTPVDEALSSYTPPSRFDVMNVHPVAMYGAHNSPRIVAQRGAFTIFGKGIVGMESTFSSEKFPKECLIKIVLEKQDLPDIRRSVLSNGITESVVFPDLDGLAKEIKREFQFAF
jgi:hypothetical protein